MKSNEKNHILLSGLEFRAIRKFSRITQETVSSYLGYNNTETIRQIERQELVPEKFCKILEFLSQYDLSDRAKVDELLNKIPQKYKEILYNRRVDSTYATYKVLQHIEKQKQKKMKSNRKTKFPITINNINYLYDSETNEVHEVSRSEMKNDA
jgi:transcriptional regulator with XRE-family HTH domain